MMVNHKKMQMPEQRTTDVFFTDNVLGNLWSSAANFALPTS